MLQKNCTFSFSNRFLLDNDTQVGWNDGKLRIGIAVCIGLLTVLLLGVTDKDIGVTWDEPTYILASETYMSWFQEFITQPGEALSKPAVDQYWSLNHEHPPFDKVWSGIGWEISKGVLDDLTAHRLSNILLAGVLVGFLYYFVSANYGNSAGLFAAAALITMPRFFFHAHLAALDVPVAAMIFISSAAYASLINKPRLRWALLLGALFGLAFATKVNALVTLPVLLTLWTLIFLPFRKILLLRLFIIGIVAAVLYWVIWPWLYYDTFNRISGYLSFMTVHHYKITQYYHGQLFSPPHWHFPFAMTLMVVPLSITILDFFGSFRAVLKWRKDPISWLFILGALLPLIILAMGKTQVFDNERLFMPAFPFLAGLSGIGFSWLLGLVKGFLAARAKEVLFRPLIFAIVCFAFIPHIFFALQLYPHLLTYYSETVGGLPGATKLKMETVYWCEAYKDSLDYLNKNAPYGATVWVEGYDTMLYYQRQGLLRSDLQIAGGKDPKPVYSDMQVSSKTIDQADFAVVQYRQSGFYNSILNWLNGRSPVFEVQKKNIRIMGVFTNSDSLPH